MGTLGPARHPQLAFSGGTLNLVWEEDDRSGKPEIWTRTWDGTSWLTPVCLTQDAIPSRAPVIAEGRGDLFLVWQDGAEGSRSVVGRYKGFFDTDWGPTETISMSSREAIEPSVAFLYNHLAPLVGVVWTDTRDFPDAGVFLRVRTESGEWHDEIQVTDAPGSSRSPCIFSEPGYGTHWLAAGMIVYESDQTGTQEVYGICVTPETHLSDPFPVSEDDDVPSMRPNVHGFAFTFVSDFSDSTYSEIPRRPHR